MGWLSGLGTLAELIMEIMKLFQKKHAQDLVMELKNAKTPEEKQKAASLISLELYK